MRGLFSPFNPVNSQKWLNEKLNLLSKSAPKYRDYFSERRSRLVCLESLKTSGAIIPFVCRRSIDVVLYGTAFDGSNLCKRALEIMRPLFFFFLSFFFRLQHMEEVLNDAGIKCNWYFLASVWRVVRPEFLLKHSHLSTLSIRYRSSQRRR